MVKPPLRTTLVYIALWVGYLFLIANFLSARLEFNQAFILAVFIIIPQAGLVYLNIELMIPKYLITKNYSVYALFIVGALAGMFTYFSLVFPEIIDPAAFKPPPEFQLRDGKLIGPGGRLVTPLKGATIINTVQTAGILLLSSAFKTSQIALRKAKEAAELKSENLDSELKFLKSQVNPHFLFNSLNNLYALAITESPKTPDIILKLSEILRYMIYDGNADKVPLIKEVEYLKNYIELFKLKDENIQNIKVHFGDIPEHLMIEPMMFIPFVENSFKHSKIEDLDKGWIEIALEVKEQQVLFSVINSIPDTQYSKDAVGGIGLENIKRRLDLLYHDRHELRIEELPNKFTVQLSLLI